MVIGALAATSVATAALQNWATSHAHPSNYQPPSLMASPASYDKQADGVMGGVQRARPRVIGNLDGRV